MLTILVVEDHALVREGLLTTLKGIAEGVRTIGVQEANEAIAILEGEDVDLIVLDLMLPGTKGQTFLPVLRRRFPTVPVVILSALDDADTVAKVMRAGASGFVSKSGSSSDLLTALRAVLDGEIYLPPKLREQANRSEHAVVRGGRMARSLAQRFGLTVAQERVLELLTAGSSNRQIAEMLGLTEGTVKIHVSAIIKAMGVTNRSEAALLASRR